MSKVVTGKVRFSYVNIFNARSINGGEEKYSICLLIPKDDKVTLAKINAAVEEAIEEGISSKWNGKKPANLKLPLRDGDVERETPECVGMYFLNANSKQRPGIVDRDLCEILDADEVYSGCYGRASINFYPYNANGNRGVGVGLNNVQKLSEGERLGGNKASAESDFGDGFEDTGDEF